MFDHNRLNHGYYVKHIYKNRTSRVHTRFSLPQPVHQISSLLPFTCTAEKFENNNSARVPWTKLESANILFKGKDKVIWALVNSTIVQMRAPQQFHRGLLLTGTQRKK